MVKEYKKVWFCRSDGYESDVVVESGYRWIIFESAAERIECR